MDDSLRIFIRNFWSKIEYRCQIPTRLRDKFSAFQSSDYFESMLQAIQIWKEITILTDPAPEVTPPPDILDRVFRIRRILEDSAPSSSSDGDPQDKKSVFYGVNLFKCPLLRCSFFNEGFPTKSLRDQHILRHNRSFYCMTDDCTYRTVGFGTLQQLERHAAMVHGTTPSLIERGEDNISLCESSTASTVSSCLSNSTFPSSFTSKSSREILWLASEELVTLLVNDDVLRPLFPIAIEAERIGGERFARKFRRLLRGFARDLKIEAQEPLHKLTAGFVGAQAAYVTQSIRKKYDLAYKNLFTATESNPPDIEESKKERVDQFLQDQESHWATPDREGVSRVIGHGVSPEASTLPPKPGPDSENDDFSSENDDGELPDRGGLRSLEKVRKFMIESYAYDKLRWNFREFVQLTSDEQHQPERASKLSHYWVRICSLLQAVIRSRPRPGYQRITWTCVSSISV